MILIIRWFSFTINSNRQGIRNLKIIRCNIDTHYRPTHPKLHCQIWKKGKIFRLFNFMNFCNS